MLTVFWDIDGTLLTTAGAGNRAWREATRQLTGLDGVLEGLVTAGLTDVQIASEIAARVSGSVPGGASALINRYEALLPEHLAASAAKVLPGVREILDAFRQREDVASFVLTGNTRTGASVKLEYFSLDHYFVDGAFSDGSTTRVDVAARAVTLAERRLGARFSLEDAVVIGDTPHDIHCARAVGVRALAVASNVHTMEQLAEHAPWALLQCLPSPGDFARRLGLIHPVTTGAAPGGVL